MIDYENPNPETLKEWEKEYRNKCRREMRQYLKDFPDATLEEKRDLSIGSDPATVLMKMAIISPPTLAGRWISLTPGASWKQSTRNI